MRVTVRVTARETDRKKESKRVLGERERAGLVIKNERHVDRPRNTKNQKQTKETWAEEEREVRDSEREAPSVTERFCVITSRESPSQPSEDWQEEEE